MAKKTIKMQEPSFIQAINISKDWCSEWENDLLSDEVLADRIKELIKTKNGRRGFFAYTLSDSECSLLDKLPSSLIFKLREVGEDIVEITIKNFFMSTAQILNNKKLKKFDYAFASKNISDRCINLLKVLDTHLVTKKMNDMLSNLDNMGNNFNSNKKYSEIEKNFIRDKVQEISQ
tara:strand:+ start:3379 stop:3906 length:528 start_codon:yes stop_codon:yes gene_type:complete